MPRRRVIDELRALLLGQEWRYDRRDFAWRCAAGEVRGVSRLAPRYDGDDDSFESELWLYPAEGAARRIAWWTPRGGWTFDRLHLAAAREGFGA